MSRNDQAVAREPSAGVPEPAGASASASAQRHRSPASAVADLHHIVIVGGGAGGLVLATRLGDTLGRRGRARITLVDSALAHVWKPLLHEVAAGTLRADIDGIPYLAHAPTHHFSFQPGRMIGLDRAKRQIILDAIADARGVEMVPGRRLAYDTLVIAIGSVLNDFGVQGVREHCLFLNSGAQAEGIQQRILALFLRWHVNASSSPQPPLRFAIVGGGATGVEFAAELRHAANDVVGYGLARMDPERDVEVVLIEAAPSLLPALPERLQQETERALRAIGVTVRTAEQVSEVKAEGVGTRSGHFIPADLTVWCAGVMGPPFLSDLDELEVNRAHQLVVEPTLRTTRDPQIFAFGDCAQCPQPGKDRPVPPRAQAAYQQAHLLARSLARALDGKDLLPFVYKDYGSLISLSYSTIGNLMGNLFGSLTIEGWLARMAYLSLYKRHQLALHGVRWVVLSTLANFLQRGTRPQLKLH